MTDIQRMFDWHSYVLLYPMTPYGGIFLAGVGLCVALGAILPRFRATLVWIGFALGSLLIVAFGATLAHGLHPPTMLQVGSLVLAIVLEIAAFRFFMPNVRRRGDRATYGATMGIVGAHFFVMLPAFGPLIGMLGLACTLNAAAFWRLSRYPASAGWFVDGCSKLVFGLAMLATSPAFVV
jgi:hypothetical protein